MCHVRSTVASPRAAILLDAFKGLFWSGRKSHAVARGPFLPQISSLYMCDSLLEGCPARLAAELDSQFGGFGWNTVQLIPTLGAIRDPPLLTKAGGVCTRKVASHTVGNTVRAQGGS